MIHIKNFIDRVSSLDSRPGKDLIMPSHEAKALRDEIVKLMADKLAQAQSQPRAQSGPISISGGTFK